MRSCQTFLTWSTWSTYLGEVEVTVQEAKTHLSRLLRMVEAGETVVIRRGRVRIAVLSPAPVETSHRAIWGDLQGRMGADFDSPIPDFEPYTQ